MYGRVASNKKPSKQAGQDFAVQDYQLLSRFCSQHLLLCTIRVERPFDSRVEKDSFPNKSYYLKCELRAQFSF
jgi:hypothetical protein